MRLQVDGVRVELSGTVIVDGIGILVAPGEVAGLIGPNGSGKSTLLRTVYRHLRPAAGAVTVGGRDVWDSTPRAAAQRTAAVPQEGLGEFDLTVREVVSMGRTPHKRAFTPDHDHDREVVAAALADVGLTELAERHVATLSGGERQRALVARALAQEASALVLDEPTNHLDIRHQLDLLELVTRLQLTTLTALHDLNLAAAYCHRLHVLHGGRLVASGAPAEVLTTELLADVFSVAAEIVVDSRTGRPRLLFSPLRASTAAPTVDRKEVAR